MQTYRVRWPVAIVSALPVPLVFAVLASVWLRPVLAGVALGVGGALVLMIPTLRRVRRRSLELTADGLEVQRDQYGLRARWDDVTGVGHRRVGFVPVDELHLENATVVAQDSRGRPSRLPARLDNHPATKRIQVSFYDKNWRSGPIGDQLRRQERELPGM